MTLHFFCLLPIPILVLTISVMYRRKQHTLYPVFWACLIFHLIQAVTENIAYHLSYKFFFYSYWSFSAGATIFTLLLLRGIFLTVLEGYSPLKGLRRSGYEVVFLAFWILGLLLICHNDFRRTIPNIIFQAEQAVSFTAVGMFVFVVGSSALLGIRWTSQFCGIALGVGLLGIVDLAVFAAFSRGYLVSNVVAGWIETIAYNCAVGIYAFCFVPMRDEIHDISPTIKPECVEWLDGLRSALSK